MRRLEGVNLAQGGPQMDRRALMQGVALAAATWSGGAASAFAQDRKAADAPMLMPDGSTFPRWEQPLSFSKTYYVDNGSPNADDNGPGDSTRPFRTIGKAAQVLQPGERVVIASGIYRECIRPARGGTGPTQMISYEAAPGAKVYVRGSEALKDGWTQETIRSGPPGAAANAAADVTVWRRPLTSDLFPDAYNPFALPSIMGSWGWLDGRTVDLGPYLRRRGLVFVDGKPLEPMEQLRELAMPNLPQRPDFTKPPAPQAGMPPRRRGGALMQEIGGSPTARFWIDHSGTAIYVRLASGRPPDRGHHPPARARPRPARRRLYPGEGRHLPARRQCLPLPAVRHDFSGRRRPLDPRRQHHRVGQRHGPRHRQ